MELNPLYPTGASYRLVTPLRRHRDAILRKEIENEMLMNQIDNIIYGRGNDMEMEAAIRRKADVELESEDDSASSSEEEGVKHLVVREEDAEHLVREEGVKHLIVREAGL